MKAGFRSTGVRHEFKYLIDEATADRVRAAIEPFCTPDPMACLPGGRYHVLSLYFDTPDLRLARANELEIVDRFKLRIRTYPDTPSAPVFYEVKRRIHDVFDKRRGMAPPDWRLPLTHGGPSSAHGIDPAAADAIDRFRTLASAHGAQPVLLCHYDREAWVARSALNIRITFDRQVRGQRRSDLGFDPDPGAWRHADADGRLGAPASGLVLELKFGWDVPIWLSEVSRRLNLSRAAFSKYCRSIAALQMRPPLRAVSKPGVRH